MRENLYIEKTGKKKQKNKNKESNMMQKFVKFSALNDKRKDGSRRATLRRCVAVIKLWGRRKGEKKK